MLCLRVEGPIIYVAQTHRVISHAACVRPYVRPSIYTLVRGVLIYLHFLLGGGESRILPESCRPYSESDKPHANGPSSPLNITTIASVQLFRNKEWVNFTQVLNGWW